MEGKQKPNPTLEDNELLRFINFAMEYLEEENFQEKFFAWYGWNWIFSQFEK